MGGPLPSYQSPTPLLEITLFSLFDTSRSHLPAILNYWSSNALPSSAAVFISSSQKILLSGQLCPAPPPLFLFHTSSVLQQYDILTPEIVHGFFQKVSRIRGESKQPIFGSLETGAASASVFFPLCHEFCECVYSSTTS